MRTTYFLSAFLVGMTSVVAHANEEEARSRATCATQQLSQIPRGLSGSYAPCGNPSARSGSTMTLASYNTQAVSFDQHQFAPNWVYQKPSGVNEFIGVGFGSTPDQAMNDATHAITLNLMAYLQESRQSVGAAAAITAPQSAGSGRSIMTSSLVTGALGEVRIQDAFLDGDTNEYWVLASLPAAAITREQGRLVRSVLDTIADASEGLVQFIHNNRGLDRYALDTAVETIQEIELIGKTDLGKASKTLWRNELRAFKKTVKQIVNCVDVAATYTLANGTVSAANSNPVLEQGSRVSIQATCGETPLVGARLATHVKGGMVQVPAHVYTDSDGRAEFEIGAVLGTGVRIGFTHEYDTVPGALWLGSLRPHPTKASIQFRAPRAGTVSFQLNGVSGEEKAGLEREFAQMATREWGAQVTSSGAILRAVGEVRFGETIQVRNNVSMPVEIDLSLTMSGSGGGSVLDTTLRTGGVGASESEARNNAMTGLRQRIARLKVSPQLDPSVRMVLACALPENVSDQEMQSAVEKCIEYSSTYEGMDKAAVQEIAKQQMRSYLSILSRPDIVPETLGNPKACQDELTALRQLGKRCKALLNAARTNPDMTALIQPICKENRRTQTAVRSRLNMLNAAIAAERERQAQMEENRRLAAQAAQAEAEANQAAAEANRAAVEAESAARAAEANRASAEADARARVAEANANARAAEANANARAVEAQANAEARAAEAEAAAEAADEAERQREKEKIQ